MAIAAAGEGDQPVGGCAAQRRATLGRPHKDPAPKDPRVHARRAPPAPRGLQRCRDACRKRPALSDETSDARAVFTCYGAAARHPRAHAKTRSQKTHPAPNGADLCAHVLRAPSNATPPPRCEPTQPKRYIPPRPGVIPGRKTAPRGPAGAARRLSPQLPAPAQPVQTVRGPADTPRHFCACQRALRRARSVRSGRGGSARRARRPVPPPTAHGRRQRINSSARFGRITDFLGLWRGLCRLCILIRVDKFRWPGRTTNEGVTSNNLHR